MGQPISVACELCNSLAKVAMTSYTDLNGKVIEWPKVAVKSDGIYFTINCPTCGAREQKMANQSESV